MKSIGRSVLAVLAGLVVGSAVIMLVELVAHQIYPPPTGLDLGDPAALRTNAQTLPAGAFALVLVGWVLGTFAGALLAGKIAGRSRAAHGLAVAAIFLLGAVANMAMIPHPVWMWVLAVVVIPLVGYMGARLVLAAERG